MRQLCSIVIIIITTTIIANNNNNNNADTTRTTSINYHKLPISDPSQNGALIKLL